MRKFNRPSLIVLAPAFGLAAGQPAASNALFVVPAVVAELS